MSGTSIVFDPLLPWPALALLAMLVSAFLAFGFWRGLAGTWLRLPAALLLLAGIAQPALQREERQYQSDIVVLVVDRTASQSLSDRVAQTDAAVARVTAEIAALPNTELRTITVTDATDNAGTLAMTALAAAVAEEPKARLAGAILISDGRIHDLEMTPALPAPLNLLLTGQVSDWDRRLTVASAPSFGIIGEPLTLTLRIDELGAVPTDVAGRTAEITVSVDGAEAQTYTVPVGEDLELQATLDHGGQNVIQIGIAALDGEITDRNNTAILQINGVRDRLRVLLISGEPHAGERTWRNLLKSDSSVDLVHFTILRPPEKQDGVPVNELSLIAFPTRELFVDKIAEFDLIIFDRYKLRGILPSAYLDNIRDYVEKGGALLVSAGPDFASVESLYYSGLGDILPAAPTGLVLEEGYKPTLTDLGQRHPVTRGLDRPPSGTSPAEGDGPWWGRWLRQIELADARGQVVMEGAGGRPLLVLDRAGEGRIALLASDQIWLWARGFEGGGPQLDLLRRLAHWLMKEPELEEEALTADATGLAMTVTRRTMEDAAGPITVTGPDGTTSTLALTEQAPGEFAATWTAPEAGLYRLTDGTLDRAFALGPASPKEYEEPIASPDAIAEVAAATNGGALSLEDGAPDIRNVREGRPAVGRGWIGVTPRNAYLTTGISLSPILPAWAFLVLASVFAIAAWLREGGRIRPSAS
jgi:hypothetical protein